METFIVHTGRALPLRRSNVDTDQIIPAEYLKRMSRHGFEDALFAAWRQDPSFVLNEPRYAGATCWSPGPTSAPGRRASTRCGRSGLRLPRRALLAVRRHLPRQQRQDRPAPGGRRPRTSERIWDAVEADPAHAR